MENDHILSRIYISLRDEDCSGNISRVIALLQSNHDAPFKSPQKHEFCSEMNIKVWELYQIATMGLQIFLLDFLNLGFLFLGIPTRFRQYKRLEHYTSVLHQVYQTLRSTLPE